MCTCVSTHVCVSTHAHMYCILIDAHYSDGDRQAMHDVPIDDLLYVYVLAHTLR